MYEYSDEFSDYTEKQAYNKVKKHLYKVYGAKNHHKKSDSIESYTSRSKIEYNEKNSTVKYEGIISVPAGTAITPEIVLEHYNLDKSKWKVVTYKSNFWQNQAKDGKLLDLYQSTIIVRPATDSLNIDKIIDALKDFKPNPIRFSNKPPKEYGTGSNCLVLPIVDLHYNLLATDFVTGNEYNCSIATNNLRYVVDDVLSRTADMNISSIIFPIGNDLFTANGLNNTTFRGTPQDVERDMQEAYVDLYKEMVNTINKLAERAKVEIVYIPSNHDKEITFYFMHSLSIQYANSAYVTVDYSPLPNKYIRFGNTLMMFSHDMKMNNVSTTIMGEAGDKLYGTKYIEVFLAHLHHEIVNTEHNLTIRRLPTTSGESRWTKENNYGAGRLNQAFIVNNERNITDIIYTRV